MSLDLQGIGLRVGAEVLVHDVSLRLERGALHVLLGPTLAGKTTLMRLMAGLDRPTTGRLLLDGRDITGTAVRKRSVAMVYQQFVNYPTLSVYENIASPLRVAGVARAEIERRVQHAAGLLRLEPMLGRMPAQLSGGQQQRTAIARALVKQAELVLLDEPLGNLDYKLREELREELPRLFAESGAILVYATTEPTEALLLGGTTVALTEGRVVQSGPAASVYRHPDGIEAARVFSDPPLNELAFEKRGMSLLLGAGQRIPAPAPLHGLADGPYRMGFRADDVTLGALPPGALSVAGTVEVTEINGSESFVHVSTAYGTWVCLMPGVHEVPLGTTVDLHVDTTRAFVFGAGGHRVMPGLLADAV